MAKKIEKQALSVFEQIRQTDENGNEFWAARQLAKALEYTDFRNFLSVIEKAKEACKNSGQEVSYHLVEFNKEITHGKGAVQVYQSYKLSRYACYLIVQNADPSKEIVALGQTYFAVQTRLHEIRQMDEYNFGINQPIANADTPYQSCGAWVRRRIQRYFTAQKGFNNAKPKFLYLEW